MERIIYADKSAKGKIGISTRLFEDLAMHAIEEQPNFAKNKASINDEHFFTLAKPVKVVVRKKIAHIVIAIAVLQSKKVIDVTSKIHQNLSDRLLAAMGHFPMDIQISVEELL